jgi:hypothetical protein
MEHRFPGKCETVVQRRSSIGIMGKGRESFGSVSAWCARDAIEGGRLCRQHQDERDALTRKLEAKRQKEQS